MCATASIVYGGKMSLEAATARLPKEMLKEIEALAEEEQVDRSELMRRLIASALKQRKVEKAVKAYGDGRVTLWKAAEMAGLSLRQMMEVVREARINVPYTVDDLERDIAHVKKAGRK